jgi:hypothetical protein
MEKNQGLRIRETSQANAGFILMRRKWGHNIKERNNQRIWKRRKAKIEYKKSPILIYSFLGDDFEPEDFSRDFLKISVK